MNLIAITGKAGSGKDEIASYLCRTYANTWKESFADPLKRACAAAFGIPLENFMDSSLKEIVTLPWNTSPRKVAQYVGTEMFRDTIGGLIPEAGHDFWVLRMAALLDGEILTTLDGTYSSEDTIVIPDLRFQNEYEFVSDRDGLIIHLTRDAAPDTVGIPGHSSENGIRFTDRTYHISNNGTKEDLYDQVEQVLTASGIILFTEQTTLVQRT